MSFSIDSKPEVIKAFLQNHDMPWNHALLPGGRNHTLPTDLSVSSIPRAFLVGRDGRILENRRGVLRGEKLGVAVDKAMK